MEYGFNIKYINGSYVGFLNNIRATSNFDSKEEVNEDLKSLENILNQYDKDIIKSFLNMTDKKEIEKNLLNKEELVFMLDMKSNSGFRKSEINKILSKLNNESISFKRYCQYFR